MLSVKTSVMVCNSRKPNPEKLSFAAGKGIPAVHAMWLWECIHSGQAQPYDQYLLGLTVPLSQKTKPDLSITEGLSAVLPEKDNLKIKQKTAPHGRSVVNPRDGLRPQGTLELSLSGPLTPTSTSGLSSDPGISAKLPVLEQNAQSPNPFHGLGSLPLQDIDPNSNSPRRPPASSNDSTHPDTKPNSIRSNSGDVSAKPAPIHCKSRLTREPSPDSVIPPASSFAPSESDPHLLHSQPKACNTDYSDMMSKLLANRKMSTPADREEEKGRRKRKPLGRAQSSRSNQSTADNPLSRQSSNSLARLEYVELEGEDDGGTIRKAVEVPQPSQELGWDSPGAQKARERMVIAMGGKVDSGLNVMEEIGVVRDKVTDEGLSSIGRRMSRKRRN
jgi:DNA replication regulator DPB11